MKRILFSTALALAVLATALQAQTKLSTTRFGKQHESVNLKSDKLPLYKKNVLEVLKNADPATQAQTVQNMRDLERMFPNDPFEEFIEPLTKILKNEDSDRIARRLAALALDELHSEAGDAVIEEMSISCKDVGLRDLCVALQVHAQTE
jgi:hypothetical protein